MSDRSIKSIGAKPSEAFNLDRLQTPIGTALLVTDADGILRALDWEDYETRMKELLRLHYGAVELKQARAPRDVRIALQGYFKGDLDRLAAIDWRVAGTAFQQNVWHALPKIPAGTTLSYGALAAKLERVQGRSRRRSRKWLEPDQRGVALSSPDRRQRFAGQIWRRTRAEALAAATRGRESPGAGR